MSDPRKELARQRATIILQVRSGQLTATQAARLLGISRKSYYQWEGRALEGMLKELEDQPPGRPSQAEDPEKLALREKIAELERELAIARQTAQIRELLRQREENCPTKKNSPSSNKS